MRFQIGIVFLSIIVSAYIVSSQLDTDNNFETLLDNSSPYVGATIPKELGYDGTGIVIGVIDTGIDHTHPDLFGFGTNGKIIGGYNFIKTGEEPLDYNGHGTQVAGIIAADGQLQGIAPGARIMTYKVSDDGELVASGLIINAIDRAIKDEVDIINISLGVNRTNTQIDNAVKRAVDNGIVVITAAGNDGPELNTIGSPARTQNSITVGATYNNVTSSLVATLKIDEKEFQVLPMIGVEKISEVIEAEIVFGEYGRERDLSNGNFQDIILLVERGSDVEDEIVYFSDKESNAADAGAKVILIYNNKRGNFLGELFHNSTEPNYEPRIPAVSMSREDGLVIKNLLEHTTTGIFDVFYDPDFVAFFSSRGPVSPFYNKPDLVAPGVARISSSRRRRCWPTIAMRTGIRLPSSRPETRSTERLRWAV